jgi:hypothetical protein
MKFVVKYDTSWGSGGGSSRTIMNFISAMPNTTYTYSCYMKASDNFSYTHANLIYHYEYTAVSGGSKVTESGVFSKTRMESVGDGWYRCWGSFTTKDTTNAINLCWFTYPNKEVTYWVGGWQIEQNDHVTPFVLGSRDENIVYDCSGYDNNGTSITETIQTTSDSPRNSRAISFNGTYDGILIENLQLSNIINSEITYSFWIKPSGDNGARSVYFGSYGAGASWSLEKTASNLFRGYWNGSPDVVYSGATITDGTWQHICVTKKGTNDIKVYINGEQKSASTTAHNTLSFPTTYRIGRDYRQNDGTPYKGLMSDFRIYATALSADDVLQLYNASAFIAKDGTAYAYELVEV